MSAAVMRDDVLVSTLIRQPVVNEAGEKIGDIDDLILDQQGRISAALVQVGSFIGAQEKLVAIPFNSLSIVLVAVGRPRIIAELSRPYLAEAPGFMAPGPSSLDHLKDTAVALRAQAAEKASELRHRAADAVSKVTEIAAEKVSDLGHKATDAAFGVRKRINESGPDLIQKATEKFSEVGHKITDITWSLIHKTSEHSLAPKFKHDEISGETTEGRNQVAPASTVVRGFFEHEQRPS